MEITKIFTDQGLTRAHIKSSDIDYFIRIAQIKIDNHNLSIERHKQYWGKVLPIKDDDLVFKEENGELQYLRVFCEVSHSRNGYREIVSFFGAGDIWLCEGTDENNTTPVVEAFITWCNYLKKKAGIV